MRNYLLLLLALVLTKTAVRAQSSSDGAYTTTYGNISWITEVGPEYPDGAIMYGDYKGNGTLAGTFAKNGSEVTGSFHNGAAEGKFVFFAPSGNGNFFNGTFNTFKGNWGYTTDNRGSTHPDHVWNALSKISSGRSSGLITAVWSGKWNTTDGHMILLQTGNKVTGTYKDVGTIDAVYDPATQVLKGSFYNNNLKKQGFLEFRLSGNAFKGKWRWNSDVTLKDWDGTKAFKTNKEPETARPATPVTTAARPQITIRISLLKIVGENVAPVRFADFYGFVGVELVKLTGEASTLVKSFGNKPAYFFNTTEDKAFITNGLIHNLPDQPDYRRDFVIDAADWDNPEIRFEIRLWHHLKGKVNGPNLDYGKFSDKFDLKTIRLDKYSNIWVGKNYVNGNYKDEFLGLDKSKALFKVNKL